MAYAHKYGLVGANLAADEFTFLPNHDSQFIAARPSPSHVERESLERVVIFQLKHAEKFVRLRDIDPEIVPVLGIRRAQDTSMLVGCWWGAGGVRVGWGPSHATS